MVRYATYIRASTDTQETTHQRNTIDNWLFDHDVYLENANQFVDLS